MDAEKRGRLDRYLDDRGLESVWFARPNSFAWLTGGSNVVDREEPIGVAAAGYDGTDLRVVTDTVEADRLSDEELPDEAIVETYPWYDDALPAALSERVDGPAAADVDAPGLERVDASALRQPLTDDDLDRYREVGRRTAVAVESVCRELRPEDTEREVAAALSVALGAEGIESPVVLVGGSERARRYRHPTPTDDELGAYAIVSVTAERGGLHASCTRTVAFDPPEWVADRHAVATRVEATALAATRREAARGGRAGEVFAAIRTAYAELGEEGEWKRHHQGGAAGYAGREWIATPDHDGPVTAPMAYAWNPTVKGTKSEDTVLVTDEGFEVLTSGDWPTRPAEAVGFDVELQRPDVLRRDG